MAWNDILLNWLLEVCVEKWPRVGSAGLMLYAAITLLAKKKVTSSVSAAYLHIPYALSDKRHPVLVIPEEVRARTGKSLIFWNSENKTNIDLL